MTSIHFGISTTVFANGRNIDLKYRAEIDGLRALAVVPVILFHAGFKWFSGGYVGVDIFFVISGYLITTILIEDIESNQFSIVNFYERRARRILPALFFVMLLCIPFAWMWMLPIQMKDFFQSVLAVSLFISNILFWRESGYFQATAEEKPLLHTWSLAVEEQYYLLFPIFLFFAWRYGKQRVFWIIVFISIISLVISEWGWRNDPSANFFLAPSRAWELLAGSIAAFIVQSRGVQANNVLSLTGLAAVFFAIFVYDENTPFPSFYALIPVLGVVLLVLFASKDTIVGKVLSLKPFVGVGLISYSAYLWHQPMFAFARIRLHEPSTFIFAELAVLSLGLGYLSWKFIEQPFRSSKKLIRSQRVLFVLSSTLIVVFILIGLTGHIKDGFKDATASRHLLAEAEKKVQINYGIHKNCEDSFNHINDCRTSEEPTVLLWGDSYAMQLYKGIYSSNPSLKLQQHTYGSCSPILNVSLVSKTLGDFWSSKCIKFNDSVFEWLRETDSVEFVVLSSMFAWIEDSEFIDEKGVISVSSVENTLPHLLSTIKAVNALGKRVVVVSPTPRSGFNVGSCLLRKMKFSDNRDCNFSLNLNVGAISLLEQLSKTNSVYWLHKDICENDKCFASFDNTFIYRDRGHLSIEGSAFLGINHNWYENFRNLALSPVK